MPFLLVLPKANILQPVADICHAERIAFRRQTLCRHTTALLQLALAFHPLSCQSLSLPLSPHLLGDEGCRLDGQLHRELAELLGVMVHKVRDVAKDQAAVLQPHSSVGQRQQLF